MTRRGSRAVLGAGIWVGVGLLVWNLGNYIFFVAAGRLLGPGDYGLVAALLAAVLVVSVPFTALQPALTSAARPGVVDGMYTRALRAGIRVTLVSITLAAVGIAVAEWVNPSVPAGPLLVSLLVLIPAIVFPLSLGHLQAVGRFGGYAAGISALGVPRPIYLGIFWVAGLGLYAPLLGSAATTITAAALALWLTRAALRTPPVARREPAWLQYRGSLVSSSVGVSAIAVLTNLDVIVARLSLDDHRAGLFAAAAAIAKAVFLVPQAIATVLLPRVAARTGAGRSTGRVLALGVLVTLVAGGLATLIAVPLGETVMRLTFGDEFAEAGDILVPFMGAMTLMGVLIILLYHQMGRRSTRFAWVLVGATVLQAVLLVFFHDSTDAILAVDAVSALAAIAAYEWTYRGTGEGLVESLIPRRSAPAPQGGETRGGQHDLPGEPDD